MTEQKCQNIEDLMKKLELNMTAGEFAKLTDIFNLSETEIDKFEGIPHTAERWTQCDGFNWYCVGGKIVTRQRLPGTDED